MKRTRSFIMCVCVLSSLCGLCGCAGLRNDAADHPPSITPPPAYPIPSGVLLEGLSHSTKVKLALMAHLRISGRHPEWGYGAFFVKVDQDEMDFFHQYFLGNIPRIDLIAGKDASFPNLIQKDGVVTDRITGKESLMYLFEKLEVRGNLAEAEVTEFESSLSVHVHKYTLRLKHHKWTIETHTTRATA